MMISISRIFAAEVLTLFISTESSCPKPQMMAATMTAAPPSVSSIVRFSRLMRWKMLVKMIPASVEKNVASRIGMKMSVGWAAPICARYTIIEIGISVRPDVFSTRNMIIGFEAVTFRSSYSLSLISPASLFTFNFSFFTSSSCSIAFRPNGVAALSSPSMFAAMFIKIEPVTG